LRFGALLAAERGKSLCRSLTEMKSVLSGTDRIGASRQRPGEADVLPDLAAFWRRLPVECLIFGGADKARKG